MSTTKLLKFLLALAACFAAFTMNVQAQDKDAKPADKPADAAATPAPKEESSVTEHSIKIGAQTIPYKATAATVLLKNEKDEPIALALLDGIHAQRCERYEHASDCLRL